jgi:pimeloyl-ACP methyl ester carboxylesterase
MIHVLPGMGADHRMYSGAWLRMQQTQFLDWPKDSSADSIPAIATEIIEDAGISDGDILIGSSLGGIVACEIAKVRTIEHLILVGSAVDQNEVSGILRLLHPLIDLAPFSFLQIASGKLPSELCTMFSKSDATFIRNMCRAIFKWEGLPPHTVTLTRIHGRSDRVIPPPRDADLIDGGHLIAMTHADHCVRLIEEAIQLKRTTQ